MSEVNNSEEIKNENNELLKKEIEEVKKDMKIIIAKYQNVQKKLKETDEK